MINGSMLDAISAYRKTSGLPQEAGATSAVGAVDGKSFGAVLQDVIGDSIGGLKQAEQMSQAGVVGKASPVEIATAVAEAETSLHMLSTLREKIIAAYQEVTRMSI